MAQSDWDFSDANWAIDNTMYVSSPSSLGTGWNTVILSRRTDCQVLPQGQLVTQFRLPNTAYSLVLNCRNQAALGVANQTNCYQILRIGTGASAGCIVNSIVSGSVVLVGSFGTLAALTIDTWYKFRLTWWIDWGSVRFRLEKWSGSAWVQEGVDVIDANNRWAASASNRVGLFLQANVLHYDDTEIWGPS